ncbi:MAG: signal peptidase I [Clostridia bacterium]|nr:signal peptidase I [Clostridia bacterium]
MEKIRKTNGVLEFAKEFLIAFIIVIIITLFIKPMIIKQSSMEPTFVENEYIIVSRQAYTLFGTEERGDIAIFRTNLYDENGKEKKLIKRIIGLPGDTVEISGGYVYVNDVLLKEPYVMALGKSGSYEKTVIPEGYYFLLGDNREVSLDSRSDAIGLVPEDRIYGRVVARLFPLKRMTTFKKVEY